MMDPKVFSNLFPFVFRAKDEKGEIGRFDVAIKRSGKVAKSVFSTPVFWFFEMNNRDLKFQNKAA